jgi:hypothetical protein
MNETAPKTPESAAQKKARQRAVKRAAGLVEVSLWVAPEQVKILREFAESLPLPARPDPDAPLPLFGDSLNQ